MTDAPDPRATVTMTREEYARLLGAHTASMAVALAMRESAWERTHDARAYRAHQAAAARARRDRDARILATVATIVAVLLVAAALVVA